jgi:thymidine kinase
MRGTGSLHVITGCMFSGKTEELLRQLRRASVGGRSVLLIRPMIDTRTSAEIAESRSGAQYACTSVAGTADILAAVVASPCEVVAIDEAEMFGSELTDIANRLANDGYDVIISGLDTDFAGRPFGAMPELLALADSVAKLTAICTFPGCGEAATRTQRLVNNQPAAIDDPLIVIGGTEDRREPDRYEARCRAHHRVAPARHAAAAAGVTLRSVPIEVGEEARSA